MADPAYESTGLGKLFEVLGTGERLGARAVLGPLMDDEERAKFERGGGYASDFLRAKGLFDSLPEGREKLAYGAGGLLLGGLVDPLSYLGIGALTKAGRAAGFAGRASKLADQVGAGERSLLSFAGKQVPLPKAIEKAPFRALDWAKKGTAAQDAVDLAQRVSRRLGQPHAAGHINTFSDRFWGGLMSAAQASDRLGMQLGQAMNVGIGVDSYLWGRFKMLQASVLGARNVRLTKTGHELEPLIQETAELAAGAYGIHPKVASERIRAAISETLELHPELMVRQIGNQARVQLRTKPLSTDFTDYDRIVEAATRVGLGPPPNMGGPSSIYDTKIIRGIREAAVLTEAANRGVVADKRNALLHQSILYAGKGQKYMPHLQEESVTRMLLDRATTIFKFRPGGGRGKPPTTKDVFNLIRRMRFIDPRELTRLRPILDQTIEVERSAGRFVRVNPFQDLVRRQNTGAPIPERTLAALRKLAQDPAVPFTMEEAGHLLPSMSVQDINDLVFRNGFSIKVRGQNQMLLQPGEVQNFLVTDPVTLSVHRGAQADRAILSKAFFEDIKAKGLAQHESVAPGDWRYTNEPELQGFKMAPEDARWMNKQVKAEGELPTMGHILMRGIEAINTHFRGWTLSIFPTYHIRNVLGLAWNYNLASDSPQEYLEGLMESAKFWKALGKGEGGKIFGQTGMTYEQIWEEVAKRNGLSSSGFIAADTPKTIQQGLRSLRRFQTIDPARYMTQQFKAHGKLRPIQEGGWGGVKPPPHEVAAEIQSGLGRDSWFIDLGFKIGGLVEDKVRMAHVLNQLKKGASIDDAVLSMKKHFFDYQDLSSSERKGWRNAFPFYTWSRKNIPLQFEALVTHPDRIARFQGAVHGFEGWKAPEEERYLNEWMRSKFPLRIRKGKDGRYQYFLFKNWMPLTDIYDAFHMLDWAKSSLTPVPKLAWEMAANQNFFTKRKIDELNRNPLAFLTGDVGETTEFLGAKVPNHVAHAAEQVRLLNVVSDWVDNPQEMTIADRFIKHFVGRLYPFTPELGMVELKKRLEELDISRRRAAFRAVRHGDMDAVQRINQLYTKKYAQETERLGSGI